MSLKHTQNKKQELIIFDHLSPKAPQLEGMRDWYVTDLTFDAFKLENNKWNFIKDIDIRTFLPNKNTPYNTP